MSLQTDLQAAVASVTADGATLHQIVHGDAASTVTTENGPVKTVAKAIADVEADLAASRSELDAKAADAAASALNASQSAGAAEAAAALAEAAKGDAAASALDAADQAAAAAVAKITWKGAWSGAVAYAVHDAVQTGGTAYICTSAHTNQGPPDPAFWDVLASKGIDGQGTGDMLAANHLSEMAGHEATARANLGLTIGTHVQAWDGDLDWLAASLTAAGRAILDDADAGAQRDTLGLGTAATVNIGTANGNLPVLDATGYPALNGSQITALNATNLASGTVPTARLGSGAASAGVYLRGDQTWATVSTGALEFVSSATANNSAYIAFTGFASGYDYTVVFDSVVTTNTYSFAVFMGTGAGPTWDSGGGNCAFGRWAYNLSTNALSFNGYNGSHYMRLGPMGDSTNGMGGYLEIINPAGSKYKILSALGSGGTGADFLGGVSFGVYKSNTAVTAIKITCDSGNTIASGTFLLFRRRRS